MITVWVVNYTDDRFADAIGSRVFSTEAAAAAWADEYVGDQVNEEGDDRYLFAYVEKRDVLDPASVPA
jgi:hypothetical protein